MLLDLDEGVAAIVVIGVDDAERGLNDVFAAKDRMTGAEWLGAAFWQDGGILDDIIDIDRLSDTVADELFEFLFDILTDDKDDFIKASLLRIEDGEVQDAFAVVRDGLGLLKSAEAAAHTGGHDYESGVHSW